jgi:DNA-binding transcriptional MerR regulator
VLSISELANLAGVTQRAVRHYHRVGVLPEPPRRGNGYRSYGPPHLFRLLHIRRMQDLGLSLAEIGRLIDDEPADTRTALRALDDQLASRQRDLHRRREAIAAVLAGPGDLRLPPELAEVLDRAERLGLPADAVAAERDTLALVVALHPEQVPTLVRLYRDALGDEALLALGQRFAALADVPPEDPAVDALAAEFAAALRGRQMPDPGGAAAGFAVVDAHLRESLSPAQQRCAELVGKEFNQ